MPPKCGVFCRSRNITTIRTDIGMARVSILIIEAAYCLCCIPGVGIAGICKLLGYSIFQLITYNPVLGQLIRIMRMC